MMGLNEHFTGAFRAAGAARYLHHHGYRAAGQTKYVVVGEPTDNRLAKGCKGEVRLSLAKAGLPAHSRYPGRGSSAPSGSSRC